MKRSTANIRLGWKRHSLGIYRCLGCGLEEVSETAKSLPRNIIISIIRDKDIYGGVS